MSLTKGGVSNASSVILSVSIEKEPLQITDGSRIMSLYNRWSVLYCRCSLDGTFWYYLIFIRSSWFMPAVQWGNNSYQTNICIQLLVDRVLTTPSV